MILLSVDVFFRIDGSMFWVKKNGDRESGRGVVVIVAFFSWNVSQ